MNYKHLHYFWTVLRAGGIVRASEQLHLTPQTLSGQIKLLEERVGQPLLRKVGRGVEPTDAGRLVMRYADEIFALGSSLQEALASGRDARRTTVLRVGIADSVPKAVAFHVLEPAMALGALWRSFGRPGSFSHRARAASGPRSRAASPGWRWGWAFARASPSSRWPC